MTVTTMSQYPVTNYAAGDEIEPVGEYITALESEVVSHPDHTGGIGADRIAAGDPVAIGAIVGVAMTTTTAATDAVAIKVSGVFALTVNSAGVAMTPGIPIYIGATNGLLYTDNATGMRLFGTALATAATGDTAALVAVRVGPPYTIAEA